MPLADSETAVPAAFPTVSVVIPTHNRPQLLIERALRSALAQTLRDIEIIVVMDGPDPATERALTAVTDPRLRVLALPENVRAARARNAGVQAARGEWIALLDDDDEWHPDKLERQLEVALRSAYPQPIVACQYVIPTTQEQQIDPPRFPRAGEAMGDYLLARDSVVDRSRALMSTVLFARRELFLSLPFQPDLRWHEDWDWLIRAAARPEVGIEGVEENLATWYFLEPRESLSSTIDWRYSLKWAKELRREGLLSDKAYVGFVVAHVSHFAAKERSWQALRSTAAELLWSRPRAFEVVRYAATWLFPQETRRTLNRRGKAFIHRLMPSRVHQRT